MLNGRTVGAELREVPPECLPVWGQRWDKPRLALGPSPCYANEFNIDAWSEGSTMLTANTGTQPVTDNYVEYGDPTLSLDSSSPMFLPLLAGSLDHPNTFTDETPYQNGYPTYDADDSISYPSYAQFRSPSDADIYQDHLIHHPTYPSTVYTDNISQNHHKTFGPGIGAFSAYGQSFADITQHNLTLESGYRYSIQRPEVVPLSQPTSTHERQLALRSGHHTPLSSVSSSGVYPPLPHHTPNSCPVSNLAPARPEVAWYSRADHPVAEQSFMGLSELPTSAGPTWRSGDSPALTMYSAPVTPQPHDPLLLDSYHARLSPVGKTFYALPGLDVDVNPDLDQLFARSTAGASVYGRINPYPY